MEFDFVDMLVALRLLHEGTFVVMELSCRRTHYRSINVALSLLRVAEYDGLGTCGSVVNKPERHSLAGFYS